MTDDDLRDALDALTDAMHYHQRRCVKDQPHDHALLRKIQAAIARIEAEPVSNHTKQTDSVVVPYGITPL